jgi:hypothetical protein
LLWIFWNMESLKLFARLALNRDLPDLRLLSI